MSRILVHVVTLIAVLACVRGAQSASSSDESSSGDFFSGLGKDLLEQFSEVAQVGADFAEGTQQLSENFASEVEYYGVLVRDSVRDFLLGSMRNFLNAIDGVRASLDKSLSAIQNRAKRELLASVRAVAERVNQRIQQLRQVLEDVQTETIDKIDEQVRAYNAEWTAWATQQIADVSEATNGDADSVREAQRLTTEYTTRHTNELGVCSDELSVEVQSFEQQVQASVEHYQPALEQLIRNVVDCLRSGDGLIATRLCQRNVSPRLSQLATAADDFQKFIDEGVKIKEVRYQQRTCVVKTVVGFRVGRSQVEVQLKDIVETYQHAQPEDTTNP